MTTSKEFSERKEKVPLPPSGDSSLITDTLALHTILVRSQSFHSPHELHFVLSTAVIEVSPQGILENVLDQTVPQYDFCMCNPPFFKDNEERLGGVASGSRSGRRPHAGTFSSASIGESVTKGGEVEFVTRIIQDSLSLGTRVRWAIDLF